MYIAVNQYNREVKKQAVKNQKIEFLKKIKDEILKLK